MTAPVPPMPPGVQQQPITPPPNAKLGGMMIWWGVGLMGAAVVAVIVAIVVGFSGLGETFSNLDRDVAVRGSSVSGAPGRIDFDVLEPLNGPTSMRVGIGVPVEAVNADCWFESSEGSELSGIRTSFDTFLTQPDYSVQVAAELEPGSYTAVCDDVTIEEFSGVNATFVVGRVIGEEIVEEFFSGFGRSFVVIALAALVGTAGLILLIVGLIRRSSSRRPPMPPPSHGTPAQWGPPPSPHAPPQSSAPPPNTPAPYTPPPSGSPPEPPPS
jgi:hypothetical protein